MEIYDIIEELKRYKDKEIYEIGSQEAVDIMIDCIQNDKPIDINTRTGTDEYLMKCEDGWCSCSSEFIHLLYDYYESDINDKKEAEAKAIKETHISLNNDLL